MSVRFANITKMLFWLKNTDREPYPGIASVDSILCLMGWEAQKLARLRARLPLQLLHRTLLEIVQTMPGKLKRHGKIACTRQLKRPTRLFLLMRKNIQPRQDSVPRW